MPSGSALEPIETPLVFSGFQAAALQQFASQLQSYGFVAAQGGTAAPRPDDSQLKPGDMAGMVLVQGDASINSACTVTAVQADRVFLCGHPFLSLGDVQLPMARSRVLTTLSSSLASTKIVNVGGSIGTITGDHITAVTGKLGAPPAMIPLELTLASGGAEKKLHFELVNHPRLTPILVALTTFSGLTQNSLYGEGTTLHLSGEIRLQNHPSVEIENTFAPGDALTPDGLPIALTMQNIFWRLFTNNFEATGVEGISLRVESVPGRHSFTIESAWLEKGEAAPGETLRVRVLVRPYRGPARVEETTVRIPEQAARGSMLRVLVSDADMLNRASRGFAAGGERLCGPGSTDRGAQSRAPQRSPVRGTFRSVSHHAVGRQGIAQRAAFGNQHRRRAAHAGQRADSSRIAGQRIFHPAGRPGYRGHFTEPANTMRAHIKNRQQGPAGAPRISILASYLCALAILAAACAFAARAEHTRHWRTSSYEEFLKGTAHGVAVRSDGRIELAPKFTLVADADASYLWSLRTDPKGTLYTAGGSPAKVFRFDAAGKPSVVFESSELSAKAIAFDALGNLYVGTSPDGKVYRVSSSGEKSVFFDPKTKYIWDLAFSSDGTLYVATGDKGQIFAVNSSGKGELFYSSDEAHIRVLAFDAAGNLIAGTEPSGRVLRVTRSRAKTGSGEKAASGAAQGFVLYETPKREVTALAMASDGTIYVSAIGERTHNVVPAPAAIVNAQGNGSIPNGVIASGQAAPSVFIAFPPLLSSGIYRISPAGAADELWTSREDVVYGLGLAADGRLLAGTGNNGALLAIDSRGVFAQLAKAGSAQITGISRGRDGRVFVCTANPGKVFSVGPEFEAEGSYESRSFDAQIFSQWGSLEWWSPQTSGAQQILVPHRAGQNLRRTIANRAWNFSRVPATPKTPARNGLRGPGRMLTRAAVDIPAARFAQWKAVIHGGRPGDGVDWASLAYLPRNVAPVIDGIAIQDPGVRANATAIIAAGQPVSVILKMPPTQANSGVIITQSGTPPRFEPPPQGVQQKGYASVLWSAHDDNDDDLRYAVYYRGENEQDWKLLKDKLEQKFYSWDTTSFADGAYYLKIVASDYPSNSPAAALTGERVSERFEVDNTPPVIENLEVTTAARGGSPAMVSVMAKFVARDASTSVERAQYSVDGGDWILVAPLGNISDAPEEKYEFTVGVVFAESTPSRCALTTALKMWGVRRLP